MAFESQAAAAAPADEEIIVIDDGDDGAAEPTLAELATEQGWVPKDKFRGNPKDWKPAHDYLRAAKGIGEARGQKKAAEDFDRRLAKLDKIQQASRKRELQGIHSHYEGRIREAVKAGDADAERGLRQARAEHIEEVEGEYEAAESEASVTAHPLVQKFNAKFDWAMSEKGDDEARSIAIAAAQEVVNRKGTLVEQLRAAEDALKWAYPERFETRALARDEDDEENEDDEKPQRRQPPAFEAPARNGRANGGGDDAVRKLPNEARAQMKKDIAAGLYKTPQEWAKVYHNG